MREGGAALRRTEQTLVEFSNGCICCKLRDDLLQEVPRLAEQRRYDYLPIESTGIAEPMPVAATVAVRDADGFRQMEFADVLVISKCDQIDAQHLMRLRAVLRAPNREAAIVGSVQGEVPLRQLLDTGRFDFTRARRCHRAGWRSCAAGTRRRPSKTASAASSIAHAGRSTRSASHAWCKAACRR